MRKNIANTEELYEFAGGYIRGCIPRADGATLITLSGELGAGKTTFVQGVAKALGVAETITSPTFVIEKIYKLGQPIDKVQGRKWEHLIHIDAYRLKSAHELRVLGWEEITAEPGNLILLEWPERVSECVPQSALRLRFDIAGEGRIITLDGEEKDKGKE